MGVSLLELIFLFLVGVLLWRGLRPLQRAVERRLLKMVGRGDRKMGDVIDITPEKRSNKDWEN